MDQAHWIKVSDVRIAEAQALLAGGFYAGAYYLAGYAVECRLKAFVVKVIEDDPGIIFREPGFQNDIWTHDFKKLLKRGVLEDQRNQECLLNPQLRQAWNVVFNWAESVRYGFPTELQARELYTAVSDPNCGVLAWIDKRF